MLRYYRETDEFNGHNKFDTITGELVKIREEDYNIAKKKDHLNNAEFFDGNLSNHHVHFPRRVYFQITRKCNLDCPYCFIKASKDSPHLDFDVILNLAAYLGKNGLMEVRLTGGEPTIHPDFCRIVEAFHKSNVYVSIATNGMWSASIKEFFKSIPNLWLIVSIDGEKEIHNKYRRNSFDKIISNIKEVTNCNPGIKIRINTVLTKENIKDLEYLCKLTLELKAESITFIPLRPQVRNLKMREQMLSSQQFKEVLIELTNYKKKYNINFTTTLETEYKQNITPDKIFTKRSSCAAGREGTNLDFNASEKKILVYGCSYTPASDLDVPFQIRKAFQAGEFGYDQIEKFFEIWDNDANWEIYRNLDIKSEKCLACDELGKRCTGSCPIQNLNVDDLCLENDIIEQLKYQIIHTSEWYCYK
jgi:MoaA/NifB/PqqE/SkfB family radical SAM enzyme